MAGGITRRLVSVMGEANLQTQYDYIFRTTSNGLIIVDEAGCIARMNPAAASMLRVTPEECLGKKPGTAFADNRGLVGLLTFPDDITHDIALPQKRRAVGFGTIFEAGGRIVVLQDVTERNALDSRRESLTRTIAHDLRNPIAGIEGFGDLVLKFGEVNDRQKHFLNRIRQTSQKLHDLMGTLVDLAWIEAGMPLEHVPVQLHLLIDSVVGELATFARVREVAIAVSTQDPLPIVIGDPLWLRQAIYHLLHNAILYSSAEQSVAIHAWQDEELVFCSVADQGIGIMPSEIALIFDRMFRSNDEYVRDLPGGGLGLTMVRTIIVRHGGEISVDSTYGQGSTFMFWLPLAERQ